MREGVIVVPPLPEHEHQREWPLRAVFAFAVVAAGWGALTYPMTISGAGILVCLLTNYFATDWFPVKAEKDIETVLKTQLAVSSALMTPVVYFLSFYFLPAATCGECGAKLPAKYVRFGFPMEGKPRGGEG